MENITLWWTDHAADCSLIDPIQIRVYGEHCICYLRAGRGAGFLGTLRSAHDRLPSQWGENPFRF